MSKRTRYWIVALVVAVVAAGIYIIPRAVATPNDAAPTPAVSTPEPTPDVSLDPVTANPDANTRQQMRDHATVTRAQHVHTDATARLDAVTADLTDTTRTTATTALDDLAHAIDTTDVDALNEAIATALTAVDAAETEATAARQAAAEAAQAQAEADAAAVATPARTGTTGSKSTGTSGKKPTSSSAPSTPAPPRPAPATTTPVAPPPPSGDTYTTCGVQPDGSYIDCPDQKADPIPDISDVPVREKECIITELVQICLSGD